MPGAFDMRRDELASLLSDEPGYRTEQVWNGLWERGLLPGDMTDLPKSLRERLRTELKPALQEAARSVSSDGQTTKWLWQLADGRRIETVLMLYPDRATVCVSSQAGCAMGCGFCATGQAGFDRQLSVGEIVEQVVEARRQALPRRLGNVVFMGMGEPLANYDRTWSAVQLLHSNLGISARRITLSTVGVVPGIRRLATEALPVNLAVSLHAARDELRDQIVPLNRRYPLAVLMRACGEYLAAKGRRLSLEWALIDGVNDTHRDASELAELALPLAAHVNLIPLNPTPGYATLGARPHAVAAFRDWLRDLGVNATVRANRGTDISAACGQLASRERSVTLRPNPTARAAHAGAAEAGSAEASTAPASAAPALATLNSPTGATLSSSG
ncbi:MAG TPA: 23S rRNA (adenine(2503)-C(2))-methyltransferase RlmN [Acidimicrobiales bacterium]|nr:23S rRNA (adenine(2503)-C(2))-methyltransferase RlmN [Acidimicrobiales bacterium]